MPRMIFPNLPTRDLPRSMGFWRALGFEFNEQFTSDQAAALVINDGAAVMLVTEDFFRTSTDREIADTSRYIEVSNAIQLESREEVDDVAEKALAAGGIQSKPPSDEGFMYSREFTDPDGHLWHVHWFDPAAFNG